MQYLAQLASVKDTATALTLLSEKYNGTKWEFICCAKDLNFQPILSGRDYMSDSHLQTYRMKLL